MMSRSIPRRQFVKLGAALSAGVAGAAASQTFAAQTPPIRLGIVGVGNRGTSLLHVLLGMEGIAMPAVCDVNLANLQRAQAAVEKMGRSRPEGYARDEQDFRRMLARDDLDGVIIATPWNWHTPMAVAAMRAGKYVGVEVPAALTIEECWELVDTAERTGVPCMMLENWSFRRDNLAVLNMIRAGLLGEVVHAHCAYSHNCVMGTFFDGAGDPRWMGEFLIKRNAAQYPTHALGPILSWLGINCGDAFASLTATATGQFGITSQLRKKFGPDHPGVRRSYRQGDIVTAVIRTQRGKTVVVNNDMQLPRPYDNRWLVQGTEGIYSEAHNAVYLEGRSPRNGEWEPFGPYQERYEHAWWTAFKGSAAASTHGGTDYLELDQFVRAVRARSQTPIDVYDSVTMSAVVGLSERSITQGGAPVAFPDFTRGRWATRKPMFAT
jgi:predicted dehydrogenase